ncbi:ABC transporter ATP-binding protein [Bacteroidales bacterium]|nr:ABC transporter ATP-binding protein [Bacteroidales bacterium]
MFDLDRFEEIWITISRNKVRSFLTGFGVFWGIFMLVIMLGAGSGLERGMMKNIDGFATNSCFFYSSTTSEAYKGFKKGRSWNLKNRDVEAIKNSVKELDCLSPMLWGVRSNNNVAYNNKASSFSVRGLYPDYTKIEQQRMRFGRFINDVDILYKRKVCVIGTKVHEDLFVNKENPLGFYIRVNGIYYMVVGVASSFSEISIGGRAEESVIIPFSTMQQINNQGDRVHFLGATAKPGVDAQVLEDKIKQVIMAQNNIAPTDKQAVGSFNIEKQFKIFDNLFLGISLLVWIVGMGTLFAGVIGVSNIMLVTVKERTREIGVRRALGAKPATIMAQIMSEGLLLTSISGVSGLCFGVAVLSLVGMVMEQAADGSSFLGSPIVPFNAAVQSMVVLLVSGLISGAIPAWRALKIKAIDAIREE